MEDFSKRQIQIMNASIQLIAESGIQNLTTRNLAEKMGITEPALYRHFKNKTDIILSILILFEERSKIMIDKIILDKQSNFKKLETIFLTRCKEFSENPELAKVIFSEEIFQNEEVLSQKVSSIMEQHRQSIKKIIEKAQESKELRSDIPKEHIALIIMGTLRLIVTKWRMDKFKFDINKQGLEVWNSILECIKG